MKFVGGKVFIPASKAGKIKIDCTITIIATMPVHLMVNYSISVLFLGQICTACFSKSYFD